ncbi:hypothetical protein FACS1894217_11450 [Clostridia bacterium]|nr:hypothetical protein FACS1894217_11450 [Clostridia bacterium]
MGDEKLPIGAMSMEDMLELDRQYKNKLLDDIFAGIEHFAAARGNAAPDTGDLRLYAGKLRSRVNNFLAVR